jgi:hypothetical protein
MRFQALKASPSTGIKIAITPLSGENFAGRHFSAFQPEGYSHETNFNCSGDLDGFQPVGTGG